MRVPVTYAQAPRLKGPGRKRHGARLSLLTAGSRPILHTATVNPLLL